MLLVAFVPCPDVRIFPVMNQGVDGVSGIPVCPHRELPVRDVTESRVSRYPRRHHVVYEVGQPLSDTRARMGSCCFGMLGRS